eukprot:6286754-Prymnesium_polylepis.3
MSPHLDFGLFTDEGEAVKARNVAPASGEKFRFLPSEYGEEKGVDESEKACEMGSEKKHKRVSFETDTY